MGPHRKRYRKWCVCKLGGQILTWLINAAGRGGTKAVAVASWLCLRQTNRGQGAFRSVTPFLFYSSSTAEHGCYSARIPYTLIHISSFF